jgi:hypothetical protein
MPLEGRQRLFRRPIQHAGHDDAIAEAGKLALHIGDVPRRAGRPGIGKAQRLRPQADAGAGQPSPVEQLARIDLARRRHVRVTQHAMGRDGMSAEDLRGQRLERLHLRLGKRPIAAGMAGIDQLDADRARVDVGGASPGADPRMPGPPLLRHQPIDRAVLIDAVMGAHPRRRIGHALQRRLGAQHVRIMQQQDVDAAIGPRVLVGRGAFDEAHAALR